MNARMTFPYFPAIAGALATLCLATSGHARIGETLAECSARYGAVRATLPSVVAGSDPEAARFEHGTMSVIVHFQKGLAWHVSYAQGYLSDPDKHRLLKENAATGTWEPRNGEISGNVLLWHHRESGMVGCGINRRSLNTLEIMTRPCAEAFGQARARRIQQAVDQRVGHPDKPASDAPPKQP